MLENVHNKINVNINKQSLEKALDSASFPVVAALIVHFTGDISILDKIRNASPIYFTETGSYLR